MEDIFWKKDCSFGEPETNLQRVCRLVNTIEAMNEEIVSVEKAMEDETDSMRIDVQEFIVKSLEGQVKEIKAEIESLLK